ncbi:MAG: hypothetical protein J6B04_04355 [Clostridia bacterium]|nr:hypothetical protein [Clostridia bacterium]
MKTLTKILAVSALSVAVIGAVGCAKVGKVVANTSANWYKNTTYPNVQQTTLNGSHEKLIYSVKLAENSATNTKFSVEYDSNCTYVTEFYAENFNWNEGTLSEYKQDKQEVLYVLKTELTLSGKYVLTATGESTPTFNDGVTSVCYFRSAGQNLEPVYSSIEVHSTSPKTLNPKTVAEMTIKMDYLYKTYYNSDCSQATTVYTDLTSGANSAEVKKVIGGLNETGYSVFDNASVYFAMRALNTNSSTYSKIISVVQPAEGVYKNYGISSSGEGALPDSQTQIKEALVGAGYITAEETVKYNAVSSTLQAEMSGSPHTAWFASVSNATQNWCRSTMLKLLVPLSYNLGVMQYDLKTVESSLEA